MTAVEYNRLTTNGSQTQIDESNNNLSFGQQPTRMLLASASPRTRSFPGGRKLNAVPDAREDGTRNLASDITPYPRTYEDPALGFYGQDDDRIPLPPSIREEAVDLIDQANGITIGSPDTNASATAAWGPIKGHGLPTDLPMSAAEPSEVIDNGHQMYSKLKNQGRVPSFPADNYDSGSTLADRIFEASRENSRDRKDFLPKSHLDRLIHTSSVAHELRMHLPHLSEDTIDAYANLICHGTAEAHVKSTTENLVNSYQKVFAILALIEKVDCIELLLEENVCDADLPLERYTEELGSRRRLCLRRKRGPHRQLTCFNSWNQITLRNFEQYQWATIPPFFTKGERKNVKHYVLDPSTVLPFTFTKDTGIKSTAKERRGGFSLVYQADIHPDHHNFNGSFNNIDDVSKPSRNTFAIKRLNSPSKDEFQKEVQILKRFSGDSHPHLISLLATFERSEIFYLIFPWAGADLRTYWKSENPMPSFDAATVIWMVEQCKGLAEGLAQLHQYKTGLQDRSAISKVERLAPNIVLNGGNDTGRRGPLYGRHGDIKPENILWFPNHKTPGHKGTLKISDFGLSELNSRDSKSKKRSQVPNSPAYRPPECDLRQKIIKQSYDIWTLGCLYLEFITWALGGWDLVAALERRRRSAPPGDAQSECFFEIREYETPVRVEASVKPSIREFVSELHAHPQCTKLLHSFLEMIMTEMLIVESGANRRMSCMQLLPQLEKWHKRCNEDIDFALKASPRV